VVLIEFPQAPLENVFTKDELKQIFHKAHPKTWINCFKNAVRQRKSQSLLLQNPRQMATVATTVTAMVTIMAMVIPVI
jgi:hypothetical protein